jgi:hypothetical protein
MDDDELSEFAECLQSACDEWIAAGGTIGPEPLTYVYRDKCRCPLGATFLRGPRFPNGFEASRVISGLDEGSAGDFIDGFEGLQYGTSSAFALGRLFREQYCP